MTKMYCMHRISQILTAIPVQFMLDKNLQSVNNATVIDKQICEIDFSNGQPLTFSRFCTLYYGMESRKDKGVEAWVFIPVLELCFWNIVISVWPTPETRSFWAIFSDHPKNAFLIIRIVFFRVRKAVNHYNSDLYLATYGINQCFSI